MYFLQNGGDILATMEDIARELGLSKGTVSKALNGARDISRKTQKAVLEKAVEMGYSRLHYSTGAPRIALFVIHMNYLKADDFGYDIIDGFCKVAKPLGFQVEVIPLSQTIQHSIPYDQYMMRGSYCGGVFLGMSLLDPWIKEFETCKTPTVLYDNQVRWNSHVTSIGVDNISSIDQAVSYLHSLGHRKIGYLSSALDAYVYQQRWSAFIQIMSSQGLTADSSVMGNAYHIIDCLTAHLPRLLSNGCTAILCSHDMLAHSVMFHCRELGLRIPEDISIFGFDDMPFCRFTQPPLSTIRQDRLTLGKSAFYALNSHLNDVALSINLLHGELIIRDSCGPVRGWDLSL